MNKPVDESIEKIMRSLNESMKRSYVNSFGIDNIFARVEAENKIKFMETVVIIPWYLKPFSKAITNIAYSSFKDGLSENCTDTVTIKRPTEYKPNE